MQALPPKYLLNSAWSFCLLIAALTVGLQTVWTIPALAPTESAAYWGAYLVWLVVLGLPLLGMELWLGREARTNSASAISLLQMRSGASLFWRLMAPLGLLVSVLVLAYLVVIAGWVSQFALSSAEGAFLGQDSEFVVNHLLDFLADPNQMAWCFSLFLVACYLCTANGMLSGLAFTVRLIMPFAILLMFVLIAYNVSTGAISSTYLPFKWADVFRFGLSELADTLPLAFFTVCVGMGGVMSCAAYLPPRLGILRACLGVLTITLLCTVLMVLVIAPLMQHTNIELAQGPALLFMNIPLALGNSLDGAYYGALFYSLVVLLCLGGALVLLETWIAWFGEFLKVPRYVATATSVGVVWLLAVMVSLSFNEWSGFAVFGADNPFQLIQAMTAYFLIPLAAVLNGFLFAVMSRSSSYAHKFDSGMGLLLRWHFSWFVPAAVLAAVWFAWAERVLA